jgi:molybdopterin molybdotransferase
MYTYDEALARILDDVSGPLSDSLYLVGRGEAGWVLAKDVVAEINLPPFDNSAVDGFAVRLADAENASRETPVRLQITQTVAAGYTPECSVGVGEAARIFTGAMLPPGADAIIMVEDTATDGDTVLLYDRPSAGFIRRAGSDVPHGTTVLLAGTELTAGAIGLLASLNYGQVPVYRRPKVGILSTGDELVAPGFGESLRPGQIYESNGAALKAAIVAAGGVAERHVTAPDTVEDIMYAFETLTDCDIILSSGGVSVGERDFVRVVLEEKGILNFWRVAIKPGKPLAFGRYGDALFFGLPGNPVSSLVTFELFVRPVIRKLAGHREILRPIVSAVLEQSLKHEAGRREFVRVHLTWRDDTYYASPTGAQGSHRTSSLLGADGYLIAHESHGDYPAGARLPAMLL